MSEALFDVPEACGYTNGIPCIIAEGPPPSPVRAGHKRCPVCGGEKPLDAFPRQKSGPQGRHSYCRPCYNAKAGASHRKNYTPEQAHRWNLKTRYRITPEDLDAIRERQGGLCGICGKPPVRPHTDHDHITGVVRGILCHRCNLLLAGIDDPDFLGRALEYLAKAKEVGLGRSGS